MVWRPVLGSKRSPTNASTRLSYVVFPRTGYDILPGLDGSVPPSRRSVDDLAGHFGLQEAQRDVHRALEDAELTAAILKEPSQSLQGEDGPRPLQRWLLHAGESSCVVSLTAQRADPLVDLLIEPPTAPFDPPPEDDGFDLSEAVAPVAEGGAFVVDGRGEYRPQQRRWRAWSPGRCRGPAGSCRGSDWYRQDAATSRREWLGRRRYKNRSWSQLTPKCCRASAERSRTIRKALAQSTGCCLREPKTTYRSRTSISARGCPADQLEALALAVIAGWACVTPTGDWDDLNAWQLEDRLPGSQRCAGR